MAKKPQALAIGNFIPPVTEPLIKQAVKKGIPVVMVNSGLTSWKATGALTFIGEDPNAQGAEAGRLSVAAGVKTVSA